MRFDSNLAWKEANAGVGANRDLLLALAGVFFLLPSLVINLAVPQFQPAPGGTPREMMAQLSGFYSDALPYLIFVGAVQLIGTLAILTLFTDRTRPTVSEAIRRGAIGALPCLGAQLLIGLVSGLVLLVVGAVGALTGSGGATVLLLFVAVGVFIWLWTRFSLVAPVIAVERVYNPVAVLARSWRLTRGNAARLLLFLFLLILAFVIVTAIVMAVVGIALAIALPGEPARVIAAVLSSALTAVFVLYFISALAAAHRQLAGPSSEATARTFD